MKYARLTEPLIRENGALRDGFLHGLQTFVAGMKEQVHMGVDQTGN